MVVNYYKRRNVCAVLIVMHFKMFEKMTHIHNRTHILNSRRCFTSKGTMSQISNLGPILYFMSKIGKLFAIFVNINF